MMFLGLLEKDGSQNFLLQILKYRKKDIPKIFRELVGKRAVSERERTQGT